LANTNTRAGGEMTNTEYKPNLGKILVNYGEQCHIDGYIEKHNFNLAHKIIEELIADQVREARIDEIQRAFKSDHIHWEKERIAQLKEEVIND